MDASQPSLPHNENPESASSEIFLQGIPVSPGIARGEVLFLEPGEITVPRRSIQPEDISEEVIRLDAALQETIRDYRSLQEGLEEGLETTTAAILESHSLLLQDPLLHQEIERLLQLQLINVEAAFSMVMDKLLNVLEKKKDSYSRERTADIRDVRRRVLQNLLGEKRPSLSEISARRILVAPDLAPSDTATLTPGVVLGFATQMGGPTSHTAIAARSLGIPAVVGLGELKGRIQTGDTLILDGYTGKVIVNPTEETLQRLGQVQTERREYEHMLDKLSELPATTRDGYSIEVSANIEHPAEVESALKFFTGGVGLYRTEFLFMGRTEPPNETEQYRAYRDVIKQISPRPVILRTLDLGGDKFSSSISIPQEMNPFLGWRAIRFCLQMPQIFETQLRAMYRASKFGPTKIMLPLVSSVDQLKDALEFMRHVREKLVKEDREIPKHVPVGVMIEVPSAAVMAHLFAPLVDFFSIGTNDLIQYTLAVDRGNPRISHLYEPTHPAIIHLVQRTAEAAHSKGIPVGICGVMGGDPLLIPLLLGLGVDEFSMTVRSMPFVKYVIRACRLDECKALAEDAMSCATGKEVLELAWAYMRKVVPDLASFLHRNAAAR
ncbi:MAG: phosphoenolpyruvate--protein phosphotransferase [Verrucomicrobiota bacterium]|nr:phosphoenolpyruvate--protein phosphotransferase [Verrucomicrobiota bacterium]MDD8044914.1 phosphoenolpyruvate--protein phosphotransferase [Verrucomicrobiota bacterium]MDI9383454.1 phosphoenolpyruvate--protein phosphotransferase [Verrucomicrobiota bacterium]